MKVTYFYSACVKIFTNRFSILCDPWFSEPIYDGSWFHFPEINDPIENIGDVDFIYISHIHPDHYDKYFLKQYFKKYGVKRILIADWKSNYLLKTMIRDGFDPIVIGREEEFCYEDVKIYIFPQDGESKSDIDSLLIIKTTEPDSSEECIVNANDIIFDEKIFSYIKHKTKIINLLMLSYTGAGPYPQTFYDLNDPALSSEADRKKKQFFERYNNVVRQLCPKNTLPFAGKYILGGFLSVLNEFRGVSDPVEIGMFDKKAIIPLDMGGEIDLSNIADVKTRTIPYSNEIIKARLNNIKNYKYPYEKAISEEFIKKINFSKLTEIAYIRAHRNSECDIDYFYSLKLPEGKHAIMNANHNADPFFLVNDSSSELPIIRTDLEIHFNYLFGLLLGVYNWDNARIGSHVQSRRRGTTYNKSAERFLNFLHV